MGRAMYLLAPDSLELKIPAIRSVHEPTLNTLYPVVSATPGRLVPADFQRAFGGIFI